ncbi:MAG: hypothetical protein J2P17_20945, partial [Mycobacterium sp.]|nr:hypothetical protein [Mycobacterium sp.]
VWPTSKESTMQEITPTGDDAFEAVELRTPNERAAAAAWAGLRECRTDLLAARVWALEAQIMLGAVGSAHTKAAEKLADKTADCLECCEAVLFWLGGGEHEAQR